MWHYEASMAKFYRNEYIEGGELRIIKIDPVDISKYTTEIRENYLEGNLILIENYRPKLNLDIFNFPSLKLLDNKALIAGLEQPDEKGFYVKKATASQVARAVYSDKNASDELEKAMLQCDVEVAKLFLSLFRVPNKSLSLGSVSTWRITPTARENYHLDIYTNTVLRAFWNISEKPRSWGVGHKSSELIQKNIKALKEFIASKKSSGNTVDQGEINRFINSYTDNLERHKIEFYQYDLWLCDSVKVAHQIIGGDKVAAFSYVFQPGSLIREKIRRKLNYMDYIKAYIE